MGELRGTRAALVIRARREWVDWAYALADALGLSIAQLITDACEAHAAAHGFHDPAPAANGARTRAPRRDLRKPAGGDPDALAQLAPALNRPWAEWLARYARHRRDRYRLDAVDAAIGWYAEKSGFKTPMPDRIPRLPIRTG